MKVRYIFKASDKSVGMETSIGFMPLPGIKLNPLVCGVITDEHFDETGYTAIIVDCDDSEKLSEQIELLKKDSWIEFEVKS